MTTRARADEQEQPEREGEEPEPGLGRALDENERLREAERLDAQKTDELLKRTIRKCQN